MAVDPVPWFVGGGAEHSPEVARLLAFAAFRGAEGVIGAPDLAVRALAVPGAAVRVYPGACSILNRSAGGAYQAYAGRVVSEETLPIAATGSSGGRADMVVLRVEDPFMPGEPWQAPADPKVGPYLFPRIIANVPAGATTVTELGLGYSAIPLARINLPASTGTVTQAMITDLRQIGNPKRERSLFTASPSGNQDVSGAAFVEWPAAATRQIFVPRWATLARIVHTVAGCLAFGDKVNGGTKVKLGINTGQETLFDTNGAVGGDALDKTIVTADTLLVAPVYRGTMQSVSMQARVTYRGPSGTGLLRATTGTTIVTDIEFTERPEIP